MRIYIHLCGDQAVGINDEDKVIDIDSYNKESLERFGREKIREGIEQVFIKEFDCSAVVRFADECCICKIICENESGLCDYHVKQMRDSSVAMARTSSVM